MRIDGVSRETGPHLFVYINRCYSHFLVIPSMILTGNDHDQMTGISILIHCLLTLSHTIRNSERGGNCRQETDGDLKNGLPSVCFYFTHFDSIFKG